MQGKALTPEQEEELLSKLIMADFSLKRLKHFWNRLRRKATT